MPIQVIPGITTHVTALDTYVETVQAILGITRYWIHLLIYPRPYSWNNNTCGMDAGCIHVAVDIQNS